MAMKNRNDVSLKAKLSYTTYLEYFAAKPDTLISQPNSVYKLNAKVGETTTRTGADAAKTVKIELKEDDVITRQGSIISIKLFEDAKLAISVYASGTPSSSSNVCLMDYRNTDSNQQFRLAYAGINTEINRKSFWLNVASCGKYSANSLRSSSSSAIVDNTYKTQKSRLISILRRYEDNRAMNKYYIMINSGLYLTAVDAKASTTGATGLKSSGNVIWGTLDTSNKLQCWTITAAGGSALPANMATFFPVAYYYSDPPNPYYGIGNLGECTWYCAGRMSELLHRTNATWPINSGAGSWYSDALKIKSFSCSTTLLSAPCVACYSGHVLIVESIGARNTNGVANITISEANWQWGAASSAVSNGQLQASGYTNDVSIDDGQIKSFTYAMILISHLLLQVVY